MRLVRELLVADVDPTAAEDGAAGRARRYLDVVARGLGVRGGALLIVDPPEGLRPLASTLPPGAEPFLVDPEARGATLARRAVDERRAFLARLSAGDPLVRALHDADATIETVGVLPLADRGAIGVLVLAGDETTLAADVLRTLTPALRLLALLVSPSRDGVPARSSAAALDADELREELRLERDIQAETIATLETRVAELEAALAVARATAPTRAPAPESPAKAATAGAVAAENARAAEALVVAAAADAPGVRTLVVIDTAADWERHAVRDHRIVVAAPSPETLEKVRAEDPSRIVVNVAATGGLAQVVDLRAHGVTAPILGVVAAPGQARVVGLGIVDAVGHPSTPEALVAAVERTAPRGARVFAAGRDAEALMKMRQMLAKQGLSVSMARDTKQIDELLAMVRPQVVVIDLELPLRQGYELVMRMAGTNPVPAMVLITPLGDPSPIFHDKLRDRVGAGQGVGAKQWLADLVQQKLPARQPAKARSGDAAAPR